MYNALNCRGKPEGEGAAATRTALDPRLAAVGLYDVLDYGQTQARATVPSGTIDFIETLKNMGKMLLRDAHVVIADVDSNETGLRARRHGYLSFDPGELERVLQQVGQHLPELLFVAEDSGKAPP